MILFFLLIWFMVNQNLGNIEHRVCRKNTNENKEDSSWTPG